MQSDIPTTSSVQKCGRKTKKCLHCGVHQREHAEADHDYVAKPCANPVMPNGACAMHGGKSPKGLDHWNYQGKGHAKVLPRRMLADYEAARNNPDRLSLEAEIAELRAMKDDCWRMLEQEGDAAAIAVSQVRSSANEVQKYYQAARMASASGNAEKFAENMNYLRMSIEELMASLRPVEAMEAAKRQVADLNVKVEKLLKTENSRIFDERGMISLEAALADRHTLVLAVLGAVTKHVGDTTLQKAIQRSVSDEYARLTGRRDTPAADARRGTDIIDAQHTVAQN